jgi:hypothetical protein
MAAAVKPAAAAAVAADGGVGLAPVASAAAAVAGLVAAAGWVWGALLKEPLGCCVFGACVVSALLSFGSTQHDSRIVTSFVRV